jgi:hypothetical protein
LIFFWWEEKGNKDLERIGRKRQNKVDTNIQIKSTDFIPKRKRDKHYHTLSHNSTPCSSFRINKKSKRRLKRITKSTSRH